MSRTEHLVRIAVAVAVAAQPLAVAYAAPSTGKTIEAAAQKITEAAKGQPAAVKDAAAGLAKQADKMASDVKATNAKLEANAQKTLASTKKILDQASILKELKNASKSQGEAILKNRVESAVKSVVSDTKDVLKAARAEATKLVASAKEALEAAKAKVLSLGKRYRFLVRQAEDFLKAARLQAGKLLRAAKEKASASVRDALASSKEALSKVAPKEKAAIKRVEQASAKVLDKMKDAAKGLTGAEQKAAATITRGVEQSARKTRDAVSESKAKLAEAFKKNVEAVKSTIRIEELSKLVKNQIKSAPQALENKGRQAMTKAGDAARSLVRSAKMTANKLVQDAKLALSAAEANAKKIAGPKGAAMVAEAKKMLQNAQSESVRMVIRAKESARSALRSGAEATKSAISKVLPPKENATGLKAAATKLGATTKGLPQAVKDQVEKLQASAKTIKQEAKNATAAGAKAISAATKNAAKVMAEIKINIGNSKDAPALIKKKSAEVMAKTKAGILSEVKSAAQTAKAMVAEAEENFKDTAKSLKTLGPKGADALAGAKKVLQAARREAGLLVKTARGQAKAALRSVVEAGKKSIKQSLAASLGSKGDLTKKKPGGVKRALLAFEDAIKAAHPRIRPAAQRIQRMFAAERGKLKAGVQAAVGKLSAIIARVTDETKKKIDALSESLKKASAKAKGAPAEIRKQARLIVDDAKKQTFAAVALVKTEAAAASKRADETMATAAKAFGGDAKLLAAAKITGNAMKVRAARSVMLAKQKARDAIKAASQGTRAALERVRGGAGGTPTGVRTEAGKLAEAVRKAPADVKAAAKKVEIAVNEVSKSVKEGSAKIVANAAAVRKDLSAGVEKGLAGAGIKELLKSAKTAPVKLSQMTTKVMEQASAKASSAVSEARKAASKLVSDAVAKVQKAEEDVKRLGAKGKGVLDQQKAFLVKVKIEAARAVISAKQEARKAFSAAVSSAKSALAAVRSKPRKAGSEATKSVAAITELAKTAPAKQRSMVEQVGIQAKKVADGVKSIIKSAMTAIAKVSSGAVAQAAQALAPSKLRELIKKSPVTAAKEMAAAAAGLVSNVKKSALEAIKSAKGQAETKVKEAKTFLENAKKNFAKEKGPSVDGTLKKAQELFEAAQRDGARLLLSAKRKAAQALKVAVANGRQQLRHATDAIDPKLADNKLAIKKIPAPKVIAEKSFAMPTSFRPQVAAAQAAAKPVLDAKGKPVAGKAAKAPAATPIVRSVGNTIRAAANAVSTGIAKILATVTGAAKAAATKVAAVAKDVSKTITTSVRAVMLGASTLAKNTIRNMKSAFDKAIKVVAAAPKAIVAAIGVALKTEVAGAKKMIVDAQVKAKKLVADAKVMVTKAVAEAKAAGPSGAALVKHAQSMEKAAQAQAGRLVLSVKEKVKESILVAKESAVAHFAQQSAPAADQAAAELEKMTNAELASVELSATEKEIQQLAGMPLDKLSLPVPAASLPPANAAESAALAKENPEAFKQEVADAAKEKLEVEADSALAELEKAASDKDASDLAGGEKALQAVIAAGPLADPTSKTAIDLKGDEAEKLVAENPAEFLDAAADGAEKIIAEKAEKMDAELAKTPQDAVKELAGIDSDKAIQEGALPTGGETLDKVKPEELEKLSKADPEKFLANAAETTSNEVDQNVAAADKELEKLMSDGDVEKVAGKDNVAQVKKEGAISDEVAPALLTDATPAESEKLIREDPATFAAGAAAGAEKELEDAAAGIEKDLDKALPKSEIANLAGGAKAAESVPDAVVAGPAAELTPKEIDKLAKEDPSKLVEASVDNAQATVDKSLATEEAALDREASDADVKKLAGDKVDVKAIQAEVDAKPADEVAAADAELARLAGDAPTPTVAEAKESAKVAAAAKENVAPAKAADAARKALETAGDQAKATIDAEISDKTIADIAGADVAKATSEVSDADKELAKLAGETPAEGSKPAPAAEVTKEVAAAPEAKKEASTEAAKVAPSAETAAKAGGSEAGETSEADAELSKLAKEGDAEDKAAAPTKVEEPAAAEVKKEAVAVEKAEAPAETKVEAPATKSDAPGEATKGEAPAEEKKVEAAAEPVAAPPALVIENPGHLFSTVTGAEKGLMRALRVFGMQKGAPAKEALVHAQNLSRWLQGIARAAKRLVAAVNKDNVDRLAARLVKAKETLTTLTGLLERSGVDASARADVDAAVARAKVVVEGAQVFHDKAKATAK